VVKPLRHGLVNLDRQGVVNLVGISTYYSNLMKISATADYVVLHFESGKIEVRDKDLKYFCSWYQ
jgi:hypothetical protein